uniref:Uncharacterized protein n=1 Tax=Plectus sambesii TaxID=2011161 RepID=A0A914W0Q5_9BILA
MVESLLGLRLQAADMCPLVRLHQPEDKGLSPEALHRYPGDGRRADSVAIGGLIICPSDWSGSPTMRLTGGVSVSRRADRLPPSCLIADAVALFRRHPISQETVSLDRRHASLHNTSSYVRCYRTVDILSV